jgi:hypothetical protein
MPINAFRGCSDWMGAAFGGWFYARRCPFAVRAGKGA